MSVIDTPDGQRGFVNAQSLQGSFTAGERAGTVGIPANAETLVVVLEFGGAAKTCDCAGLTSGVRYPGIYIPPNPNTSSSQCWQFDISQPVDEQVSISFNSTPGANWFVYADAGVHQVADMSKYTNAQGLPYSIPSAPSEAAGDHPLNELLVASSVFAASGNLLAAPGAGARYRIFAGSLAPESTTASGYINDSVSGLAFLACGQGGGTSLALPLTGLALSQNAAVHYTATVATTSMIACVIYTLEQI